MIEYRGSHTFFALKSRTFKKLWALNSRAFPPKTLPDTKLPARENYDKALTSEKVFIERFHVTSRPPCWCPLNNGILITFSCLVHQHGRPVLCLLCLLGLSENAPYKTKVSFLLRLCLRTLFSLYSRVCVCVSSQQNNAKYFDILQQRPAVSPPRIKWFRLTF